MYSNKLIVIISSTVRESEGVRFELRRKTFPNENDNEEEFSGEEQETKGIYYISRRPINVLSCLSDDTSLQKMLLELSERDSNGCNGDAEETNEF